MDNQQETLRHYVAGLFEGEGCICLTKTLVYGKQLSYRAVVQFTNTEPEIVQKFIDYLKLKGYAHHIRVEKRPYRNNKTCYAVNITKKKDRILFLNEMTPIFVGKKRKESELAIALMNKVDELKVSVPIVNTKGHYEKSTDRFPEYEKIYLEYKKIKDSPETTCDTPIFIG